MIGTSEHPGSAKRHYSVAIIGGGFSGAVLAAHLARHTDPGFSILVVERSPARARGVAYGTSCAGHLLNVPAGNMSAFPDDPDHFLRWARLHHDPSAAAGSFLPRRIYGQYLEWALAQATRSLTNIRWKTGEVESVDTTREAATIRLQSGEVFNADKVVLALGNFPPASGLPETVRKSTVYVANPWANGALDNIENDGSVLLVGSGLTGVDMAIALRKRGFTGTIHMLSRHGLLPQVHKPKQAWSPFWNSNAVCTASALARLVRWQVAAAAEQGADWRAVIDSLRSATPAIWQALPLKEKRRFLRHLRPYWEVHRHRIAPEIGCLVDQEIASGKIQTYSGRMVDACEEGNRTRVTFRDRKTGNHQYLLVDRILNCTGPESDCRKLDHPLVNHLLGRGLVRPDPLFLGLDVAEDGAVIDAVGIPSKVIYALGPARKGRLWETTAVPEIRQQVAQLAPLLTPSRNQPESHTSEALFAAD